MLRAAALSLLVLVGVIVMLPIDDSSAHHSRRAYSSRRSHMGHRHSRAWWRRYRARLRRQRAALRRKQALLQARAVPSLNAVADSHKSAALASKISTVNVVKSSPAASNLALPGGWSRRTGGAPGEMKFVASSPDGRFKGEATLAVVRTGATGETMMTGRGRKTLGGVPLAELRRTVIDRMVAENGWVVNDIQREIGGRPVFIVLARTGASADGRTSEQSWVFYFTEAEGRIYSLAVNSAVESADRAAEEAAQLMAAFHAGNRPAALQASQH